MFKVIRGLVASTDALTQLEALQRTAIGIASDTKPVNLLNDGDDLVASFANRSSYLARVVDDVVADGDSALGSGRSAIAALDQAGFHNSARRLETALQPLHAVRELLSLEGDVATRATDLTSVLTRAKALHSHASDAARAISTV